MDLKKFVFPGLAIMLFAFTHNKNSVRITGDDLQNRQAVAGINLTVAEGKRLIAEGIANHPLVKQKMNAGMIIITKGSTNTYIAERLMGLDAPHGSFITGNITPASGRGLDLNLAKIAEIILIDGKPAAMTLNEALSRIKEDDIVFKGANLLNYEKRQAAVCIGSPEGGTTAKVRPYTGKGKGKLIIPVGLEKDVSGDLEGYVKKLSQDAAQLTMIPRVWIHHEGEVFTEIEALKLFGKVDVIPFAAGGIAGREGGISLAVCGDSAEVKKVLAVVGIIQGEEPFVK